MDILHFFSSNSHRMAYWLVIHCKSGAFTLSG